MLIGLDIDGPIYNFDKTAQYMLSLHAGNEYREDLEWDHSQHWRGVPKSEWNWLWADAQADALSRHGHLYRGAIEFVYDLAKLGDIIVITSRPANSRKVTFEWLNFHWGGPDKPYPFKAVHILGQGQHKYVAPLDVMIDDNPDVLDDLKSNGGWRTKKILVARPWNYEYQQRQTEADAIGEPHGYTHTIAYDYADVLKEVKNAKRGIDSIEALRRG